MTTDFDIKETNKLALKKPSKWVIIVHNDNVTPMDFVVELLYYVFNIDVEPATKLMMKIHKEGSAVVGIYSHEIAEQKFAEAQMAINLAGMLLKLSLEEE